MKTQNIFTNVVFTNIDEDSDTSLQTLYSQTLIKTLRHLLNTLRESCDPRKNMVFEQN